MNGWKHHNIDSDRVQYYSITVGGVELMLWQDTVSTNCIGRITYRGRLYDSITLGAGLEHGRDALIASACEMLQAEIHELETLTLCIKHLTTLGNKV
jgi:hypothetical protein